jgi:nucleoside-diphosphate-sugar epimerase
MAILITGAAGYIGRFLANELAQQGHDLVAVDLQAPPPGLPPALPP